MNSFFIEIVFQISSVSSSEMLYNKEILFSTEIQFYFNLYFTVFEYFVCLLQLLSNFGRFKVRSGIVDAVITNSIIKFHFKYFHFQLNLIIQYSSIIKIELIFFFSDKSMVRASSERRHSSGLRRLRVCGRRNPNPDFRWNG